MNQSNLVLHERILINICIFFSLVGHYLLTFYLIPILLDMLHEDKDKQPFLQILHKKG